MTRVATEMQLVFIKGFHSAAWAVFASAIVAIPFTTALGLRDATLWLVALVSIECLVLALNGMRCPLTAVAARYTTDRRDNFDIYLPAWLARNNKRVFGALFVADLLIVAGTWWL
jgi:hypothetical protein